jgi:hypothetical protein
MDGHNLSIKAPCSIIFIKEKNPKLKQMPIVYI